MLNNTSHLSSALVVRLATRIIKPINRARHTPSATTGIQRITHKIRGALVKPRVLSRDSIFLGRVLHPSISLFFAETSYCVLAARTTADGEGARRKVEGKAGGWGEGEEEGNGEGREVPTPVRSKVGG